MAGSIPAEIEGDAESSIALVLLLAPVALRAELIPPKVEFPLLPSEGKAHADFVSKGWIVEKQAQADLNGDGRLDFMMVLHRADQKNILANPDGFGVDVLDTNPRMLVVGFQDPLAPEARNH